MEESRHHSRFDDWISSLIPAMENNEEENTRIQTSNSSFGRAKIILHSVGSNEEAGEKWASEISAQKSTVDVISWSGVLRSSREKKREAKLCVWVR